jgi:hypothetical protein
MHLINFRQLFPLTDFTNSYTFDKCQSLKDFLHECLKVYKTDTNERVRECCLSVYMAFRDHYPSYINDLDDQQRMELDKDVAIANPKVIKLRRIVIGALSKVA